MVQVAVVQERWQSPRLHQSRTAPRLLVTVNAAMHSHICRGDFGLVALWPWLQTQTPGRSSEGADPAHSLHIPIVSASGLENWPPRLRMMGPQI
ncbi:unnamed protein product [Rangifer tarandus platyrhynchus]|uniref:Uncharacterized protein n=1 Tax=Rangifer tarandus platyrhynchus TaxID=3082113 RepID=A0AC59Y3J3_RANTA